MSRDLAILISGTIFGIILGIVIAGMTFSTSPEYIIGLDNLIISNSTAFDICYKITNNTAVVPIAEEGKLICTLPTYDHSNNIIIRGNGE